jgi:hypothetical protein
MHDSQFQPGFRLSAIDIVVLCLGTIATIALWQRTWWIGFVIAFVTAHFFLFCNVFRISRPLELCWAGVFCLLAGSTIAADWPGWPVAIAGSLVGTLTVLVLGIRAPDYHGVLWQRLNPDLPQWWEANRADTNKG